MTTPAQGPRLVVAIESEAQRRQLPQIDFARAGVSPVFFHLAGLRPEEAGSDGSAYEVGGSRHSSRSGVAIPDFAQIIAGLETERPVACCVSGSGALARLAAAAADLLGIPVFYVVTAEEELRNLSDRAKERPDLFFLASESLFPEALHDPRYGSTLLPARLPEGGEIEAAIARWLAGTLPSVPPELSIIVPAYREAENLPLVCDRLLAMLERSAVNAEILLVDDASPDATYQVALSQMWRSPRIRSFSKPLPRGMGNGIRYGLRQARAQIAAVTMGDGSDEVDRIPEMLAKVRDEGYALAIGSRYRYRSNYQTVPRIYRFWSFVFRLTTRLLIGLGLSDYTNAFRVFDRRIFDRSGPEGGGFEISPEITFKAWFTTRRVAEVDVCHLKRASGQSSFSFLRAGPGYGKMLIKAFINRLTGRWIVLDW